MIQKYKTTDLIPESHLQLKNMMIAIQNDIANAVNQSLDQLN